MADSQGTAGGRRRRCSRVAGQLTAGLAIAALAAITGCSAGTAPAPSGTASPGSAHDESAAAAFPATPAGRQARWLTGATGTLPVPASQLAAHFDRALLAKVPASSLNAALAGYGQLQLVKVAASKPGELVFVAAHGIAARIGVGLTTDSRGLISGLNLRPVTATPAAAVPSTWSAVRHQIQSVAPQARFLVARVNGRSCEPVAGQGADTAAPLGSAFKLYVLDALARAIAAGKVRWNQQLTVTSAVRSLPSGTLQKLPDGAKVSVLDAAEHMISISDNTAANMLIKLLGRSAIEAAMHSAGMTRPALDTPFLTTREFFTLKLYRWPHLADQYTSLPRSRRLAFLTHRVDPVALPALIAAQKAAPWTTSRAVNSVEWFASPADICRVLVALHAAARQPKLAPLTHIMEINRSAIRLSSSQWPTVWFKGGSEPGVLTLSYLATTSSGKTYVASVLTASPSGSLPQISAALNLLPAVQGALQLAAR